MSESLSGKLLIASPYLGDPNFIRSVVLIVNHDEQGAFGLTLNRPTDRRLSQVVELSLPKGPVRDDDHLFEGGPVDGPLLALHDLQGVGAPIGEPTSRIWLTGDEDHLRLLLTRVDASVRFVSQYSGWGPNQLESEMQSGGWLVGPASAELVFAAPSDIWEDSVKRCGREVLSSISPGLQFTDPMVN
ncbi:YqgE/AlgH family protein [Roseiconus nitratireducens]|uniref:YqgE/AlgH family protein n=1 Tax=Roseiconus nitratireducens TaxID=2605748 RepID=A0A5M6DFM9_9BACT|nr:YqgE/AlgH family protein [Roseiconus nitratireducens]KAA5545150.1 YqgE/AlgH family protein [Roseiconus nitratireducens]